MRAKTELLLYQMLWSAETLLQPTCRNTDESFEGWAYRNGLLTQIHRLEAQGFVESRHGPFDRTRVHRLTRAGRIAALGGRDPEAAWSTPWDEKWRLFIFGLPESERGLRRKLTRSLASLGCGCLQGSVWIEENAAWLEAVRSYPLLPETLLPRSYLGRRAWSKRKAVLARAATLAEKVVPALAV